MARKGSTSKLRPALLLALIVAAYFVIMELKKQPAPSSPKSPPATERTEETPSAPSREEEATNAAVNVYFSDTYANDPSVAQNDPNNIDRRLAAFIAAARKTLDCAFYELESNRIADALIAAAQRGVRVRVVGDSDYEKNEEMRRVIDAGIPVVFDGRSALMHDKFVVADGAAVWTGSYNATDNCSFRNNNNGISIRSAALARNYAAEFTEMFDRNEFGPTSESNTPNPEIRIGDIVIENYFAPEDEIPPKIVRHLRGARKSIHFLAFSFSDDAIGDVLIEKHRNGLDVQGVFETRGSNTAHSELVRLQPAGVKTWQDGNKYVMHHKVFIIDGIWTITGSYNFTASAATQNDENVLIIKDAAVARRFEEEYQRIKRMATPAS